MKMTSFKKILSLLLAVLLIAAMATLVCGCDDKKNGSEISSGQVVQTELGKGATTIFVEVTDLDGKQAKFTVKTDKTTVGEALVEVGILGESDNGLYNTVNGKTIKYEETGKYWAFYVDGSYAMEGADTTKIEAGKTYAFKAEG